MFTFYTQLEQVLGDTQHAFENGDVESGVQMLFSRLENIRCRSTAEKWKATVDHVRNHPLFSLMQQCPLTCHSNLRPRGYPGDAELLDYIYFGASSSYRLPTTTSTLGASIFQSLVQAPAAEAVRHRLAFISKRINDHPSPTLDCLSVAAGHCREIERINRWTTPTTIRLTALDHDETSLAFIAKRSNKAITTWHASAIQLLSPQLCPGPFDLIYSLGLFDYLQDDFAQRLVRALFARLRPGGTLLVANFCPTILDRGFMEAFLRWELVYRDAKQLLHLANLPTTSELEKRSTYLIADGRIAVLELQKR